MAQLTESSIPIRPISETRASTWSHVSRRLSPYAFLLPALALVAVFLLWPFLRSAFLSFTNFKGIGAAEWIGLANYRQLVDDPILSRSMTNTLYWVIGTLLLPVGFGLLIAVLSFDVRGGSLYRLPFLLPYALSGTAIATVWQFMLTRDGALNSVLETVGLESLTRSWML